MTQIGRNLTDPFDGFLRNSCYLLMDRDTKHCQEFRDLLEQADVKPLRLPPRSPNLTPHIERFMQTIKEECPSRDQILTKATTFLSCTRDPTFLCNWDQCRILFPQI